MPNKSPRRVAREMVGLYLSDVAGEVGRTVSHLSRWERYERSLAPELVQQIARLYDVDPKVLLAQDSSARRTA